MIETILEIDFEELKMLYERAKKPLNIDVSAMEKINALNIDKLPIEAIKEYIKLGEEIISNNKYAIVTMAGGQRYKTRA